MLYYEGYHVDARKRRMVVSTLVRMFFFGFSRLPVSRLVLIIMSRSIYALFLSISKSICCSTVRKRLKIFASVKWNIFTTAVLLTCPSGKSKVLSNVLNTISPNYSARYCEIDIASFIGLLFGIRLFSNIPLARTVQNG